MKYDRIIVGAGSAGCVLAARLTEAGTERVLLLEAGPVFAPDGFPDQLKNADVVVRESRYAWGLESEPNAEGRVVPVEAGKVSGGGSALNAAAWQRARPDDFATWEGAEARGWSWPEILDAYLASENNPIGPELAGDTRHSTAGPVPVCQLDQSSATRTMTAFVEACRALGHEQVLDHNSERQEGVSYHARNAHDGVRLNSAMTYLSDEVRARPNLHVRADTQVDRLRFDGGRAVGVVLTGGDEIEADEIIVSAGTYGTPAILIRSGIGRASELAGLGVSQVADLPVGAGLKDQPVFVSVFPLRADVRDMHPANGATLCVRSSLSDRPDIHVFMEHQPDPAAGGRPTLNIGAGVMIPLSEGSVSLRDRNPSSLARVELNLLADEGDRVRMLEAVRTAQEIARTAPLRDLIDWTAVEPVETDDDQRLLAAIRNAPGVFSHACRTARMGDPGDPTTVTDWQGRVHGVQGLRIVDASLLPEIPSVAINPTVMMVAERIARMIREGEPKRD